METPEFVRPRVISVAQLNTYVKNKLESDGLLNNVFISGEISNLTDHYSSGHVYFSLKDERAVVRAVLFAGYARNLRFKLKEGMKVIARGRVSLYEKTGSYQLYVEDMQPLGIGELTMQFEELKKKLERAGFFSAAHKKPIPKIPFKVGVITSPTGAAVQDIRNILSRRFPLAEIILRPVLVQGVGAPAQLTEAVNEFSESRSADVLIIARGGGSIEDLWAFNDERLAYAIYNCQIPVISGVGHETDFTICDFVADLRAPTPSAAAELAVPDFNELLRHFESKSRYLYSLMMSKRDRCEARLNRTENKLKTVIPQRIYGRREDEINRVRERMNVILRDKIINYEKRLAELGAKLKELDPLSVLDRGFAYAVKDGRVVISAKELKPNDEFTLTFRDGEIGAKVTE